MRRTRDARIAMERLAELLGWEVETRGGAWVVLGQPTAEDLTFDARELLCTMTRVATAPVKWQGKGWTPEELREKIRFQPEHIFHPKHGACLVLPEKIGATVEATMYRSYFQPELVS